MTIETSPKYRQGGTSSDITAEQPRDLGSPVTPVPEATYSGFPGERIIVGGEEKRIWSTSPRGVSTPTPVSTYRVNPYVILPSYKTR